MSLTWFTPILLLLLLYSCRSDRHWLMATIIACFFQAASPLLLTAGGRLAGLQPAYALLPIGIIQFILRTFELKRANQPLLRVSTAHLFLIGLTCITVGGAFLLPKLFSGSAHVTTAASNYNKIILHASGGNAIQAFYVICNFLLFTLVVACLQRGSVTVSQCIRAFAVGTGISIAFGLYQISCDLVHLPWPDAVINSNSGIGQNFNQPVHGYPRLLGLKRRMSATFEEPSLMSMYFLGLFTLFAVGLRRLVLGGAILFCLVISTSATALVGLLAVFAIWMLWELVTPRLDIRKVCLVAFVGAVVFAAVLTLAMVSDHWLHSNVLVEKLSSASGQTRINLDRIAIQTFMETWGLGVGVGSTRSSSLIATFGACTGIPGLVGLFAFFGIIIVDSLRSTSREIRAMGFACAGLFAGWLISVPDIAMPMVWIVSGVAANATKGFPMPFEVSRAVPSALPVHATA